MSNYIETSAEDFEIFREECWKWIDIFGLKGYDYRFEHSDEDPDALAWIEVFPTGRILRVVLTQTWDKKDYSRDHVRKSAFHEICHALLFKVHNMAENRAFNQSEFDGEIHEVIRTLENILFDNLDG